MPGSDADSNEQRPNQILDSKSVSSNRIKLLVVEDDGLFVDVLRYSFEHRGFEFRSAYRVSQALEILQAWTPDVIISDLSLPDEDGFSLIQKIRNLPATSKTPALALTGYGREIGDQAIREGFDAYRTKPVDPDSLANFVLQLLQNQETGFGN